MIKAYFYIAFHNKLYTKADTITVILLKTFAAFMQICLYMSLNKTSLGGMDINNLILYTICTYAFYEAMESNIASIIFVLIFSFILS